VGAGGKLAPACLPAQAASVTPNSSRRSNMVDLRTKISSLSKINP
jgi:hypothetical protein